MALHLTVTHCINAIVLIMFISRLLQCKYLVKVIKFAFFVIKFYFVNMFLAHLIFQ